MRTISNSDDVIDSREVIERIAELESERDDYADVYESEDSPGNYGFIGCESDCYESEESATAAMVAEWADQNPDDAAELAALTALAEEASSSPDWRYGEALIRESYFTDYIEELISDCYEMPKELKSSEWPWRHVTVDYAAAAEEAKVDYIECDFDGVTYLIRA